MAILSVPIVCNQEKSNILDDKMKARINIINAVDDAKKLDFQGDIGRSKEPDSGRGNGWGNQNMSDNKAKPVSVDKDALDVWNSFELNYNNANQDDYLNLNINENSKEKSKINKYSNQVPQSLKLERESDLKKVEDGNQAQIFKSSVDSNANLCSEGSKPPVYTNVKIDNENILKEQIDSKVRQDPHFNKESTSEVFPKHINVPIETNYKLEKDTNCQPNKAREEHNSKVINVPIKQTLYSGIKNDSERKYSSKQLKQEKVILSDKSVDRDDALELTNVKVIHQSTLPETIIIPQKIVQNEEIQQNKCLDTFFGHQQFYPSKKLDLLQTEDDQVIGKVNNQDKFEVSLDTTQYRPDELKVLVGEGIISVEGKHEENSEDGRRMVSRQFSRKYSLPAGAKGENVVSNLSSDGVLVITVTKQSPKSQKEASMNIINENSRVPITIRHLFLDDPFFKSTWSDIESIKKNMFNESSAFWKGLKQDSLEKSMFANDQSFINDMMQSSQDEEIGWMFPRKWMIPSKISSDFDKYLDLFQTKDNDIIRDDFRVKDDEEEFKITLDTSQYRPDELSINVGEGIISVEGKHEENSEDGRKMVSRQFSRKYSLPAGAKAENVVSNLSSKGVLVISAPKEKYINKGNRRVPIQSMNY